MLTQQLAEWSTMGFGLRPIVLLPVVVLVASMLYARHGRLASGPISRSHAATGLVSVSGLILMGTIPALRIFLLPAAVPAWLVLVGSILGLIDRLPRRVSIYVSACVLVAPIVLCTVFIAAIVEDL